MSDHHEEPAGPTDGSFSAEILLRLPYGEQQGSFMSVVASSNRDDGFFSGENNYVNQTIYTGFRYQCVEYARRFMLLTTGCVFGNCGRASEIYKMREVTHVETGATYPLVPHDNGTTKTPPKPGDVILYPYHEAMTPWGHVGIISYVDDSRVGIIEQNQFFGPFVSPDPAYHDGERCVSRFERLECRADGSYMLHEKSSMPSALGWMAYDAAPRREQIFAPLQPLPSMEAVRSSAYEDERHPRLTVVRLPSGIDLPCGRMRTIFGSRNCAEVFVGAGTATARVLRLTLALLFSRNRLTDTFLSLPQNPLGAELAELAHPQLRELFAQLRALGESKAAGCERDLVPAIAAYFDLPELVVDAMRREYSAADIHMCCAVSYTLNCVGEDEVHSPVSHHEGATIEDLYMVNPHDEACSLAKVSFSTPRLLSEISQMRGVGNEILSAQSFNIPTHRGMNWLGYRDDFARYLKVVESLRGPRAAFTLVVNDRMDGMQRELLATLESYSQRVRYPVFRVSEEDLRYEDGALVSAAAACVASPTTSNPIHSEVAVINFVFCFTEWADILAGADGPYAALYQAAVDPASDVVFAKPLWSYLCSGLTNRMDLDYAPTGASARPEEAAALERSNAVKFFDLSRRLYALAQPRQPADRWEMEVSEYKDSCRRLHLDAPVRACPPKDVVMNIAMIDFAGSAQMCHVGPGLEIRENTQGEFDGEPAALMHLFKEDKDEKLE
ncbi:trypanothione synthetase-like protein [Strigomonas culicis]|uniref:Trypanothione synthetase-like protein n=1 Tax=Strigomonas culicis TaxID=28005 RepID=S9UE28_9TRYP|nr:trypanothione synthetase-like protein [Strigomonas culicis]|eukprot:EPY27168.1 trypanothione synthetase-like protein [Strigomonas culicis]